MVRVTARLNVGGIARHVAWLTAGLADRGYPTLLVTGVVPLGEEDMSSFARAQGVTPYIIPQMSREITPRDLVTIWKLYRLLRQLRPRLIHTHSAKGGAVGRMAGLLYRWLTPWALLGRPRPCRMVHTYHGHIFHSYYGRCKTWVFLTIERLLARLATDRIVVISAQQHDEIHHRFGVGRPGQFAVIPLGLDLTPYADWAARRHVLRDELRAGEDEILVGIVGRLTDIKNHGLFLDAIARYRQTAGTARPRGRVVVLGDGHLRPGLEARARQLGVDADVLFLGMRGDPENFYPALDVVALTSLNEGTPLTLIEGMANARPFLSTAVGGVVDLAGAKDPNAESGPGYTVCERGVLVPSGDVEGLCRGLERLVHDAALRQGLGRRGLAFIRSHYTKERLLRDMEQLYDGLLGRRRLPEPHPRPVAPRRMETSKRG